MKTTRRGQLSADLANQLAESDTTYRIRSKASNTLASVPTALPMSIDLAFALRNRRKQAPLSGRRIAVGDSVYPGNCANI